MTGALIILAATIVVGVILRLTHRADTEAMVQPEAAPAADSECCGLHAVCERQALVADGPDYYDDEELDRFAGRQPDAFSPQELDEIRDVMLTLRPDEVYPWGQALARRGIPLPDALRDEFIMLIS